MISKATEEYLKVIYVLFRHKGTIRVTDIAESMKCSKPSVTKQLNILKDNNYIEYESYGNIKLTGSGIEYAKKILADTDILYILLHNIIGISEENAKIDASKMKGVISEEGLTKISSYIYEVLDLGKMNCNFNIRNESCRACIQKKGNK